MQKLSRTCIPIVISALVFGAISITFRSNQIDPHKLSPNFPVDARISLTVFLNFPKICSHFPTALLTLCSHLAASQRILTHSGSNLSPNPGLIRV